MTTIQDRLKMLPSIFGTKSITKTEECLGLSKNALYSLNPTFNTLIAVLSYKPELSADWLIRGIGEILISKDGEMVNSTIYEGSNNNNNLSNSSINNTNIEKLYEIIEKQSTQIEKLTEMLLNK